MAGSPALALNDARLRAAEWRRAQVCSLILVHPSDGPPPDPTERLLRRGESPRVGASTLEGAVLIA
eukprot:scaffold175939_cov27-Tisochrysis_lutea.AAC.3